MAKKKPQSSIMTTLNMIPEMATSRKEWTSLVRPMNVVTYKNQSPNQGFSPQILSPINTKTNRANPTYFENNILVYLEFNTLSYDAIYKSMSQVNRVKEREIHGAVYHQFYWPLANDVERYIENEFSVVPADTHRLRNTMILSLRGGYAGPGGSMTRVGDLHPFMVVLNTGKLKYAPFVNVMPTPWLQHPGSHGQTTSTRTGRVKKKAHDLHDPMAKTNWFNLTVEYGRKQAQSYLMRFINGWLTQTFISYLQANNITSMELFEQMFYYNIPGISSSGGSP